MLCRFIRARFAAGGTSDNVDSANDIFTPSGRHDALVSRRPAPAIDLFERGSVAVAVAVAERPQRRRIEFPRNVVCCRRRAPGFPSLGALPLPAPPNDAKRRQSLRQRRRDAETKDRKHCQFDVRAPQSRPAARAHVIFVNRFRPKGC